MKSFDNKKSLDNKKVLITGASGLIGSALLSILEEESSPYHVIKRTSSLSGPNTNLDRSVTSKTVSDDQVLEINWPEGIDTLDLAPYRCLVHLALPPIKQKMMGEEIWKLHILPVECMIARIKRTNPNCQLVFVSSQSAVVENPTSPIESKYGQMKDSIERLLKNSDIPWTIVIPGLVFGASNKGLFGTIQKLIKYSPVVPLIGPPGIPIQPVYLWDLAKALGKICTDPEQHNGKCYQLAQELIPFDTFLRKLAYATGKKRVFLRLPESLVTISLGIMELIYKNPPFTRSNLIGFLNLKPLKTKRSWEELKFHPTSLEAAFSDIHHGRIPEEFSKQNDVSDHNLAKECNYIIHSIFGRNPSVTTLRQYALAHRKIVLANGYEQELLSYIQMKNLDIEAIEFALRNDSCKDSTAIGKKMLLCIHLAELDPLFYSDFINSSDNCIASYLGLAFQVIRSVYKKIKGHMLLLIHPSLTSLKSSNPST